MKSDKKHEVKKEDDLKFAPLDIQEPFKFNNSTLSPIIKYDGTTLTATSNDIFMGNQPFSNPVDKAINDSNENMNIPLMPYPISIPDFESSNINDNINLNNSLEEDSNYTDELDSNDLYSYNTARGNDDYLNNIINPLDILKTFDLQEDFLDINGRDCYTSADIDAIFKEIQANNSAILGTLKTYKVPYPISKLLLKKIIKLTLDYNKGR